MLTADFSVNGMLGKVKRTNQTVDAFDAALYTQKLYQVYGNIQDGLARAFTVATVTDAAGAETVNVEPSAEALMNPMVQAALTIFNAIRDFAEAAPHVVELHAEGLSHWAGPRETADAIDETFRLWLGDEALQETLRATQKTLDNPNGVLSGVLTAEQQQDFPSASTADSMSSN